MSKSAGGSDGFATRNAKSSVRLMVWTILWVGTMVLADKAELYQWYSSQVTIIAIIINAAIGIGTIVTFIRFLGDQDELQRKIQLDALALAMGVGLVGSFTYSLLATAKFIMEEEVSDIIILTTVTYMVGIIVGQVRYR